MGGNPLNGTDPTGLYPGEGLVKDAEKFIGDRLGDALITAKLASGLAASAVTPPALAAVNWLNEHTGGSIMICAYGCIGFEVSNGHLYLNYGLGAAFGISATPGYYQRPLDNWGCDGSRPSLMFGAGGPSGSVDLNNPANFSVGYGYSSIVGAAPIRSRRIL